MKVSATKKSLQKSTAILAITSILSSSFAQVAKAADAADAIHTGNVTMNQVGNTLDINQGASQYENIYWSKFNIPVQQTVNFNADSSSAVTINRVDASAGRSVIEGMLNSNHHVAVLNEAGITFTPGSKVNVGSLIASTAKNNVDVVDGKYQFTGVNGNGKIINQGDITVSQGGYAILAAPEVANYGTINANLGEVHLAAVNGFTVDVNGNGKINYLVGDDMRKAIITQDGTITAFNGAVTLRADKANSLAESVINLNGVVNVTGMDASGNEILGYTQANNSRFYASADGHVNINNDISAGDIYIQSVNGNLVTEGLKSIHNSGSDLNRASITLKSGKNLEVNGNITAQNNLLGKAGVNKEQRASANVDIAADHDITIHGKIDVSAENNAGGDAYLQVASTKQGNLITQSDISVTSNGVRIMDAGEAGDITSNSSANFSAGNIRHNGKVDVKAHAFHDIQTIIEFLGNNTGKATSFGFYKKDEKGNPVDGEILFATLDGIIPSTDTQKISWADLSFVDFADIGYFILPDAAAQQTGLTNRQKVEFKQQNGKWVVVDSATKQVIKGADIGLGNEYALFSDKTLNASGQKHLANSPALADGTGKGNLNWSEVVDILCDYNDYNFKAYETDEVGKVKTVASYNAYATKNYFTPYSGADITVDSSADAKNSEAEAYLRIEADGTLALGDPKVMAKAYKNAYSEAKLRTHGGGGGSNMWINAPLIVQSYAASREVGSATSVADIYSNAELDLGVSWGNGEPDGTVTPGSTNAGYVVTDAYGGKTADATTIISSKKRLYQGNYAGAIANTYTGKDATAKTILDTGKNFLFGEGPEYSNPVNNYSFALANGEIVSGRSTKTSSDLQGNNNAYMSATLGATPALLVTYEPGSGDNYTPYKNEFDCTKSDPCSTNPNTNTIGGWKTNVSIPGAPSYVDNSGKTYGNGFTPDPIRFPPYEKIAVYVATPVPVTPNNPEDKLNGLDPRAPEPAFVQKEPASGGGLFCRDVNTAGIPGLCGPAPVQQVQLAPPAPAKVEVAEPAPLAPIAEAPVFASPFKKGASKGNKKAKLANLEPGSGQKCLMVSGKKVCIEEQIDK